MASSSSSMTGTCFLGLDQASTSCQDIASAIGVCRTLECTTPGAPATSECPAHVPADYSCCQCDPTAATARPCPAGQTCSTTGICT
jgi:hypothetical protein